MDTFQPKPSLPNTFSLAAKHFEADTLHSLEACQHRLQSLASEPRSWVYGSQPDVNCVPLGNDLVKFHILRRTGFHSEVEVVGTLQRLNTRTTAVIGLARVPQSSVALLCLYALSYLVGMVVMLFIIPRWSGMMFFMAAPIILIWVGTWVTAVYRIITARNRLVQLVTETLELGES